MKPRHELTNSRLLSPSLDARRMKTDLKTSENVFLQSNSRSRSSSPIQPRKIIKNCEIPKPTAGNGAMRCDWKLVVCATTESLPKYRIALTSCRMTLRDQFKVSRENVGKVLAKQFNFFFYCGCERVEIGILLIFFFLRREKKTILWDGVKIEKKTVRAFS